MVIAVALVEPRYEVNVGHVARVMKNFGFDQLYMTDPHFNDEEAVRFSTHGKEILASAKTTTLKNLRRKFDYLIGTSAIYSPSRLNVLRDSIDPSQLATIVEESHGKKDFCIVLGREASGLNNKELMMCDLVVLIDTKTEYKTMNISHALAVLLYQLTRKKDTQEMPRKSSKNREPASRKEMDLLAGYVEQVSTRAGYDCHKQPLLNSAVQRILAKSAPSSKDVMLLVSLFRKITVALDRQKPARSKNTHHATKIER